MNLHTAIFYSNDINAVESFYKALGFKVEARNGDFYLSIIFDNGVRLGIKKATEEREVSGKQTVIVEVENVAEWFEKAKQQKLNFYKELKEEAWGTTFSIL